ncbi:MAG: PKD domain-containing protein, partial [Bacteroidota bacterium]
CPAAGDSVTFIPTLDSITAKIDINKMVFECPPAQIELNHDSTLLIDSIPIKETHWAIYNTLGNTVASSELSRPSFTIREGGYYGVRLEVEDEKGCSDIIEQDSLIHIKSLNGTIILPSDTICMGDSVSFNSSSSGATDFAWDFGEGSVFSGQQTTYAYKQPGNRIVRLILSRLDQSDNLTCQETIQDTIVVKTAPVFSLNDTSICTGDTITLNVPDSSDYEYTWYPVASSSPSATVFDSGVYSVTVRDIVVNCSTTDSMHLTINALPIINITTDPPVCINETITLESTSSPPAMNYYWTNNTLILDSIANPTTILNTPSTIYLTITDTNGCQNHTQKHIDIIEKPVLNLSDTNICPGDSVTLYGSPVNQSYQNGSYEWYYEDELWSDSLSLSQITVKNEGQYTLIFSVGTCQSTGYSDIGYHPVPDVTHNEELVVFCNTQNFATLDGGEAHHYEWAHSDSNKRYLKTNIEGTYYVTITNTEGCSNTDTIITDSRCGPLVMAPSAFIPGQQSDDKFYLHDYNVGDFHLYIFNRWGEIIFESKDPEKAWDGTYNGQLMPAGVYPWIMRYTGDNPDYNKKIKQQGSVTIIR